MKTSARNYILFILLLFISTSNKAQQSYTDSVFALKKNVSDTSFVKSVLDIPYDEAVKNIAAFKTLTNLAIEKAKQLKDSSLLAKSYIKKSLALHFTTKDEEAIRLTLKAITIFELLNDVENSAKSYIGLGWKIKHRNLDEAFIYIKKGIKELEKTGSNQLSLSSAYNHLGVLYQIKNKLDSALYFHKKSLSITTILKDSIGIPFAHSHIAEVLFKANDFDVAKKHLDSSLIIRLKRKDTYGITDSYLYLGDLFFAKKDYKNAITNYNLGYNYANKNGYFPLKKYAAEYLSKSYEAIGDYKNSLLKLKQFQTLKDSILNKETNAKIQELQLEFETAKKEKALAEKNLEIKNKNLIAFILIATLVLLTVLFWGSFKRNKLKRAQLEKEIKLKETLAIIETKNKLQEQRLEISRDLHDNIGSQLTFIISSIDNLKYVSKNLSTSLQEKLKGISGFTTETIDQLRDTIWAMNKTEISFNELHSRLLSYFEKAKLAANTIQFEIHAEPINFSFNSVEGMHLFRVIQEAVNNSIKYANATKISVEFSIQNQLLNIIISDNGIGFKKEEISEGNGLLNMENRVEKIGGSLVINSNQGKGTVVEIKLNTQ